MKEPGWGWGKELDWGQFHEDVSSTFCYLPKLSPEVVVSSAGPAQWARWRCPLGPLGAQPVLTESQVWVRGPAGPGEQRRAESHALSAAVQGTPPGQDACAHTHCKGELRPRV